MKLEKMIKRGNRIQDNANFEKDQEAFLRPWKQRLSMKENHHGWKSLLSFELGYERKKEKTPEMPWMEKVKMELREKVQNVNEFTITGNKVVAEIRKRKNWAAPGIDGIQNYWRKTFQTAHKAVTRAFERMKNDYDMIPVCWPTRRTVEIPKTKDLSNEQKYRPITWLNTSYKIMTGLIGKYMREHALEDNIWDEGQLGAVEGVLGTVDQLIIDNCIMEEVKTYHRNLAVAFYDYQKAYDKVDGASV